MLLDAGWALVGVVVVIVAAIVFVCALPPGWRRARPGSVADEALAGGRMDFSRAARSRRSPPARSPAGGRRGRRL
jgi:hypothetical protein